MRRPDAVAALMGVMKSPALAARKAAATALAVVGGKNALAALSAAAESDPEPEVRQICLLLLAR
jgi:HEAT repeat protein